LKGVQWIFLLFSRYVNGVGQVRPAGRTQKKAPREAGLQINLILEDFRKRISD
jgi:hypothetical protein